MRIVHKINPLDFHTAKEFKKHGAYLLELEWIFLLSLEPKESIERNLLIKIHQGYNLFQRKSVFFTKNKTTFAVLVILRITKNMENG